MVDAIDFVAEVIETDGADGDGGFFFGVAKGTGGRVDVDDAASYGEVSGLVDGVLAGVACVCEPGDEGGGVEDEAFFEDEGEVGEFFGQRDRLHEGLDGSDDEVGGMVGDDIGDDLEAFAEEFD